MVNRLLHPQEIEVFYILPTLRKYFALNLKERGMLQKDIAELLEVEGATVSQYLSKKRANKIRFDENVLDEIRHSAARINDKLSMLRETQHLLRFIRHTNALCMIHHQISNLPANCNPEAVGCGEAWNRNL